MSTLDKLRKIFRPEPQLDDADPAVRTRALERVPDEEQATFGNILTTDDNLEVRRTALNRLTDASMVLEFIAGEAFENDPLRDDIARRILAIAEPEAEVRRHPRILAVEFAATETLDAAQAVAAKFTSGEDHAAAIMAHPRADIRKQFAETLWQQDRLAALANLSKGHDKAVHRIARDRLANLRANLKARDEHEAAFAELLQTMRELKADDAKYHPKRDALDAAHRDLAARAAATNDALKPHNAEGIDIDGWSKRVPERLPRTEKATATASRARRAESFVETLQQAIAEPSDDAALQLREEFTALTELIPDANETRTERDRFHELIEPAATQLAALDRVVALAEETGAMLEPLPKTGTLADRYQAAKARRSATHDLIKRHGWPKRGPKRLPEPPSLAALKQSLQALDGTIASYEGDATVLAKSLNDDVAELTRAIGDGRFQDARRLERKLREAADALPGGAPKRIAEQLAGARSELRKLGKWRKFAVSPKRGELCEAMEELAENPREVIADQADAVKELREAWNGLGAIASRDDHALKERFETAADAAYEHCRTHFRGLADQRQKNLEGRRKIVELLQAYVDGESWSGAEAQDVERVLRGARGEWKRCFPVDRGAGRDIEERYNELTETVHEALKNIWGRNISARERLINRADAIAESNDSMAHKIEAIKALQEQWKRSGAVPKRQDHRLYEQFRKACNLVFEARTAERTARSEQIAAKVSEAERITAELRALSSSENIEPGAIAKLEQAAQELDVPVKVRRNLERALDAAETALRTQRAEGRRAKDMARIDRIEALDRQLAGAVDDWRALAGDEADLFAPRFGEGKNPGSDPHRIAIEAEIAAEIESPAQDAELRMTLRLERMSQTFGKSERDLRAEIRELLERWCATPCTHQASSAQPASEVREASASDALRERFFAAVRKLAREA